MPDRPEDAAPPAGYIAPGAMTEYLTDDWGFFVRSSRQFEKFRSPFQTVEVHDTAPFGKLFRLDGHFMTSERDEFFYHENLVHVAAVAHPQPERALVVGGGDGGSAEETPQAPVDQVGDAGRDRPRRRRHLAQVSCERPPRRVRRSAAHAEDRGRLRVRAQLDRAVRPHRARSDRCRRPVDARSTRRSSIARAPRG